METHRRGSMFGEERVSREERSRRAAGRAQGKVLGPRSSSPVSVYVELPCVIEQAFSTIAWNDLEDCASAPPLKSSSLNSQVSESDAEDFGELALDFMAESRAELLPFQGCVIPPLTPQRFLSPEDSPAHFSPAAEDLSAQDGALWRGGAQDDTLWSGVAQGRTWEESLEVNKQLQESLHSKQEELDGLQERNFQLRQLARRAQHLALALEKLMADRDSHGNPALVPGRDKRSQSPRKRQRLDEGYETESSDSVEEMLRDVSSRCHAVLHRTDQKERPQQEPERIRVFGSFQGLQTRFSSDSSEVTEGVECGDSASSFRTSIREHGTIRTQVFPHGHAFTSTTQQGGYRFRWIPNHS